MNLTKEDLKELSKDPFAQRIAKVMGFDLNEAIVEYYKRIEEEEKTKNTLDELFSKLCNQIKVDSCEEKTEEKEMCEDENYVDAPVAEKFIMSWKGLENFIKEYKHLDKAVQTLQDDYGIDLNYGGETSETFYSMFNEIIWKLIRLIFGDDNSDMIADYVFGTSEFENVMDLYKNFK